MVSKEVRDLLRDRKIVVGMILVPLILYPLLGTAINISTQSAEMAASSSSFGLMNLDAGNYSQIATAYFESLPNTTVKAVPPQSVADGMAAALKDNVSSLVVIPAGFSASIDARKQVTFDTYTTVTGFGIAEATRAGRLSAVVTSFGNYLTFLYVKSASSNLNASVVVAPIALNESSYLNGELIPESPSSVTANGLIRSFALPIATFIVMIFAMQIASTAMAVEKEQKTFETLLTLPVSRFQILASKLVGSTVIAAIGAATSIIGFTYYIDTITASSSTGGPVFTISATPTYYVILGTLLFLTLATATTLAIIVSVFSADVRGAQAVVGYISLPIFLPTILIIFGDFNTFSEAIKAVILAIPFSYVAVYATTGLFGGLDYAALGIAYLAAWIVGTLYLASRLFNSERVLTARFTFGRKKPTRQSS
ncbi:MAG TPA: ABC transporter permease [Nitrososphaerales archaeon]|nr:ABC transporter permease [Nitrososphaerales archaeon]